ncbi:hypothetical protein M408DRAFT_331030 [Serendipita vermifera MAFF 305830]|uniref:Uncharacterized protein n=1 Tax=Serendipita vermifera MAFF 305830 TaxID=933852 RepID=A0A0C3AM75_SERVB|nr:hypothetical protein M408DRAFT_331030 [Serendipita vermifera MAFF 305830]
MTGGFWFKSIKIDVHSMGHCNATSRHSRHTSIIRLAFFPYSYWYTGLASTR